MQTQASKVHSASSDNRLVYVLFALCGMILLSLGISLYLAARDIPPPDVSDLLVEQRTVPPEANAYTYFVSAIDTFYNPTNYILHKHSNYQGPVDTNLLVDVFEKNKRTFELLKQGTACRECIQPELLDFNALSQIPSSDLRELSNLLAAKTRYEYEAGHYAEATDTCIELVRYSDHICQGSSCYVSYLLGSGMWYRSLSMMRRLINDPNLPADQFERLSLLLSGKECSSDIGIRALKLESGIAFRTIDWFYQDMQKKSRLRFGLYGFFILQPNKSKEAVANHSRDLLSQINSTCSAFKKTDMERTLGLTGSKLKMGLRPNLAGRLLCLSIVLSSDSFIKNECQTKNAESATRIAIAYQRYLKKERHPPESLTDLVPTYLPAVPIDWFDGQPFRYLPKEKLLYSVDKDLKDSKAVWWTEGKKYLKYPDQVYPLTPDAGPTPAP